MSKKGLLVTNSYLNTGKFLTHYEWLKKSALKHQIELTMMENGHFLAGYFSEREKDAKELLAEYSFVIYWDKDIPMGDWLSSLCAELQIPVFNSVEAIANCDDKAKTYQKIFEWNHTHDSSEQIPMIPTLIAPMTYPNIGYTNLEFVTEVLEHVGLPVIVKESFGSFGMQVYLVKTAEELYEYTKKLSGKPFLYQKFLEKSAGKDVRIQVVGDEVVASMYRYSVNGDYRANITNGGHMKPYTPSKGEIELAVRAAKALKLDFAGIDLLFSNGEGYPADVLCEVNSNAHFENIHTCTRVNVADKIMDYIVGKI